MVSRQGCSLPVFVYNRSCHSEQAILFYYVLLISIKKGRGYALQGALGGGRVRSLALDTKECLHRLTFY